MTEIVQLQHMADPLGLKESKQHTSQTQLIRAIQQQRGEQPCFATDKRDDCAEICEWRRDCRKLMAVWLR